MVKFLKTHYLLLGILALAAFFRFYHINTMPGGLFPDEAANGLDVNSIFKGHLQPFFERGNGREGLFFYFLALSVALFGRGPWQHHIISAGFGFFEVLAAYFLTKRLFGKNIALLTSFLMAVSSYHVVLTRTAFRATTIPLFATLTLLFIVKYFQEKSSQVKLKSALYAGITFGLGFYTYISYRMMIPLLGGFAVILLYANRRKFSLTIKKHAKASMIFVSGFIASFAWIGYYFITHPDSFFGRAGQVSIFSKDLNNGDVLGTFLLVVKKSTLSFFMNGDLNWRHNISGEAFLSPIVSPFFAAGLLIFTWSFFVLLKDSTKRKIKTQTLVQALVAVWFWFMTVPEIVTAEAIPHGLRLVGVIPAIYILPAWMMGRFWESLKTVWRKLNIEKEWRIAYITVFLSAIFIYNFSLYFDVAAKSPGYYYAFRSDLTTASNYLNKRALKNKTYLSLDEFSVQTVEYLTTETGQPYMLLDPAKTYEVSLKKGDQVIFTMSTLYDRLKFLKVHPTARLVDTEKNQFGEIIMLVYEQS